MAKTDKLNITKSSRLKLSSSKYSAGFGISTSPTINHPNLEVAFEKLHSPHLDRPTKPLPQRKIGKKMGTK